MTSPFTRKNASAANAAVRRAAVETLEARQMLSVSVDHGTLFVTGTSGDDSIVVSRDPHRRGMLLVTVNGFSNVVDSTSVKRITVNALEGNDSVLVSQSAGVITTPTNLIGGRGNDTLSGGDGPDAVLGGPGDDLLRGGGGRDVVEGHAGNDTVYGGLGRDVITGDAGADLLYTGGERDKADAGGNTGDRVDATVPQVKPGAIAGKTGPAANILDGTYDSTDGYSPDQIRKAYGLGAVGDASFTNRGQGQTVAIVDAYHAPTIRQDLATYSAQFGLPAPTKSNFQVYYATKVQPDVDTGWAGETTLDVETVHAIAPDAKIVLVEAASVNWPDMLQAIQRAAELVAADGGGVVSMSFGGDEFYAPDWEAYLGALPSNVSLVASAGDAGAQVNAPAVSAFVTTVGGTNLPLDASGNRTGPETAWSGSGGGVSLFYPRPTYQGATTVGGFQWGDRRAVPDISFNADPFTGIATYNTTPSFAGADTGWEPVGGTSEGSPAIAAFVALINQKRTDNGLDPIGNRLNDAIYRAGRVDPAANFIDITSGTNGYAAQPGYDLVTGWGSPNGTTFIDTIANDTSSGLNNLTFQAARMVLDTADTGRRVQQLLFGGTGAVNWSGSDLLLDIIPNASSGVSISLPSSLSPDANGVYSALGQVQVQVDPTSAVSYLTQFVSRVERRHGRDYVIGEFYAVSKRGKIIYGSNNKPIFYGTFAG
jgi:hypothetical protein